MTSIAVNIDDARSDAATSGVAVGKLAATLLSLFAVDNILLLHFMGLTLRLTLLAILGAVPLIAWACGRMPLKEVQVPYKVLAVTTAVALLLFMLGGQGRFFYANPDWQIRDAVLHDMATHAWPYAYDVGGTLYFLRAPLGTYLLPAMFGPASEVMLLLSNALRLGVLMALAWPLFDRNRARVIALSAFIIFSGWDAVGTAFYTLLGMQAFWDHIERWNMGFQYSSHITQAFWVPQHAMAGWTCAVAFLLWRKGLMTIGLFAASIPLVALWSPLAILGAIPFAIVAGLEALQSGKWSRKDVEIAAAAVAVALPALLYLQVDAAKVGMHYRDVNPWILIFCALFEVVPFVIPLLLYRRGNPAAERQTLLLTFLVLLVMPTFQIGEGHDFQMRASIMPLALLALAFGEWLARPREGSAAPLALGYGILALAIGAITPLLEVRRTLVNDPSPAPLCSLLGAWHQQDNMIVPYSTYLASLTTLPTALQNVPVVAGRADPPRCWSRKWAVPK